MFCFVFLLWGEPSAFLEAPVQVRVPSCHRREGREGVPFPLAGVTHVHMATEKNWGVTAEPKYIFNFFLDNILWCGYYSWYLSVFAEVDTETDECPAVHLIPGTSIWSVSETSTPLLVVMIFCCLLGSSSCHSGYCSFPLSFPARFNCRIMLCILSTLLLALS